MYFFVYTVLLLQQITQFLFGKVLPV